VLAAWEGSGSVKFLFDGIGSGFPFRSLLSTFARGSVQTPAVPRHSSNREKPGDVAQKTWAGAHGPGAVPRVSPPRSAG